LINGWSIMETGGSGKKIASGSVAQNPNRPETSRNGDLAGGPSHACERKGEIFRAAQ